MKFNFRSLSTYVLVYSLIASPLLYANPPNGTNPGNHPNGGNRPGAPNTPVPTPPAPMPPAPVPPAPVVPAPVIPAPPAPAPQPTGPSQASIDAARALGIMDAQSQAHTDAAPKGTADGVANGTRDGRNEGFQRCEKEQRQRFNAEGFKRGFEMGREHGHREGEISGRNEGATKGQAEGYADGKNRANQDAYNVAAPAGRAEGQRDAQNSDARSHGTQDGIAAGDRDARETADRVDYPRGVKEYRDSRWNEAVDSRDSLAQKAKLASLSDSSKFNVAALTSGVGDLLGSAVDWISGKSDVMQTNGGNRNFPSAQENQAYTQGYQSGYGAEYQKQYQAIYQAQYNQSKQQANQAGCQEAMARDYRDAEREGMERGRSEGYNEAFHRSYEHAFRESYDANFRIAAQTGYSENYQNFYNQHFSAARADAYKELYDSLYHEAFRAAHDQKYSEVYAGYARAAFDRGQKDEAEDFRLRPVRLLDVTPTETIVNGVFEPGEALRLTVNLRNFSSGSSAGKDVELSLTEVQNGSSVISEPKAVILGDLKSKSITTVTEALEFRMNHNSVNQEREFNLRATYQGRLIGEKSFVITPKYMVDVKFAASPRLLEGLKGKLQFKVRNQSNQPTDANTTLSVHVGKSTIELIGNDLLVGSLNPGEEKIVAIEAIGRSRQADVDLPLILETKLSTGRRIFLSERDQNIPLVNDYRIAADPDDVASLRQAGLVRLTYKIRNVGSREVLKGLQLKLRFNQEPDTYRVIGPNPQYLSPLRNGESLQFVIPVLVKNANQGGIVELEVQEDGRTTVINQNKF